ncbi:hypothetical protein ACFWG7_13070 [Streptomyces koyangensis]|uniref:hypothetical protein n=1 Tax=Streptomyces koyangensis TaxID=188770 RepID=UPI003664621F
MTATRTPTFPGRATYRQAAVVLLVSGLLAGCGLGEPDQTYQQAYDAMYPDAKAATEAALPGVEVEQLTRDTTECGGLDISADKDASKLSAYVTVGGEVDADDRRSLADLVRAVGARLVDQGWRAQIPDRSVVGGESPAPEGELALTENSEEAAEMSLRKADVHGWVKIRADVVEGFDWREVTTSVATKCLRNSEWKEGEDESW